MKKVLIFTGAGISVPLGLPSTSDFIDGINSGAEPITRHICGFLGDAGNDIERILSTLEDYSKNSSLVEFILQNDNSDPHVTQRRSHIDGLLTKLRGQANRELLRIKSLVHDRLGNFSSASSCELYINLIKEIRGIYSDAAFSIITTNYDLTFDSAFEDGNSEWESLGIANVDYGFPIKYGRPIYDPKRIFKWSKTEIEYLKIHGSVDWHRDNNGGCSRTMSRTKPFNPNQMAILYPGFKGIPEEEPFRSMHEALSRRLSEADMVIVIGFAFRDPYINSLFEHAIKSSPDKEFLYFNPALIDQYPEDSSVPRFINTFNNIWHIERGIEISDKPLNLADAIK